MTDVVIVGSGPGGVNAAAPLVAAGRRVLMLDYGNVDPRYAPLIPHRPFTDIRRDGTLAGPNLDALRAMIETVGDGVIASGGIGRIEDVAAVAETGAEGVIIGRALYDGRVDLAEAISLADQEPARANA